MTIKPIDLYQARKGIRASHQVFPVVHSMDLPRNIFTVKLMELKLQGPSLA